MMAYCELCGYKVEQRALESHQGSTVCKYLADLHEKEFVPVGNVHATVTKTNVETRWVPTSTEYGKSIVHTRVAPRWAVRVAKCTSVAALLRIAVINHCVTNGRARKAIDSAFRLGMEHKGSSRSEIDQTIEDLFLSILGIS